MNQLYCWLYWWFIIYDQQFIWVSGQRVCVCLSKAIIEYTFARLRSSGLIIKQPPSCQYCHFRSDKVKIVGFEHAVPQSYLLVHQKQPIMCQQKDTVEATWSLNDHESLSAGRSPASADSFKHLFISKSVWCNDLGFALDHQTRFGSFTSSYRYSVDWQAASSPPWLIAF